MNNIFRKIMAFALTAVMFMGIVPFAGMNIIASAAETYSGTCGENLTWTLNAETGELVISGEGEMYDYDVMGDLICSHSPWLFHREEYVSEVKTVVITEGVTSIGDYAFLGEDNILFESISLPDSIEKIGEGAFLSCENLKNISVGENIKYIGEDAFYGTGFYIEENNWNNGVLYLDNYLLKSKGDIQGEYTILEGITLIANEAFAECSDLASVDFAESIKYIGSSAFYGCTSLASIEIPDSVTNIGSYAFSGCTSLASVKIPDSVTSIDYDAFSDCTSLASIEIPDSVTSIGSFAFYNTAYYNDESNWENNILYIDNHLIEAKQTISGDYSIKEGTKTIADYAFRGCTSLASIEIPDSVTSIGSYAFSDCTNLAIIEIPDSVTSIYYGAFNNTAYYNDESNWDEGVLYIGKYLIDSQEYIVWYPDETGLTSGICDPSHKIKEGTKVIAESAYANCYVSEDYHTEEIYIPSSIISIGAGAFGECSNVNDVYFDGTEEEWNKITIEEGNEPLLNATIHFLGESEHVHSYTAEVTKNATCKETGIRTYTCSCGDTYTEVIPQSHSYSHISVPSTCTVAGMEYDICSGCGEVINSKVLPLASHTLSHIVVESTCTVKGMEYDVCSVCGGTFNTTVLSLKPHSWSDWKVVREATATLEGLKERACTVCGTTEEELIPKLNVIVDDESGISIEFNDEYDSGVEIKVEEVFDGDSFQILDLKYGNSQSVVFDITTEKDGVKVQPDGKVKVRIPLPKGFDATKLFVCYVDSTNGTVTNIPAKVVNGYVEFETDHFSYYAIVEKLGKVNSVSIDDVSMSYKDGGAVVPSINIDSGVKYTVTYSSSNTDVVSVDSNGNITTNGTGDATITVTVTDEYGNTVTDTCNVNVSYTWWQWIIVIVLFGWIWY